MRTRKDLITLNRLRSINALILCGLVICCTFIGVVMRLVAPATSESPDTGMGSFHYFTILSNIIMAFCATLCIPFEIDGLRNHNYHLPRWIVNVLYCGACLVSVTFTVAVCIIVPVKGVTFTLIEDSNLFLHLIGPIAAILLFIFVNDDHYIELKQSLLILIPVSVYVLVYWFEVIVIGEENGGWRDIYYTKAYIPYWVSFIAIYIIVIFIANLIRMLHNKRHLKHKWQIENYYLTDEDFNCGDIHEAIVCLAKREKANDKGGEVIVPRRIITILKKRYHSDFPLKALCKEYLDAYLD